MGTHTKTHLGPQTCGLDVRGPIKAQRQRALWGEEGQRNARAFATSGSEGYGACPDKVRCGGPPIFGGKGSAFFAEL